MRNTVVTILCFWILLSACTDRETNNIDNITLFTGEPCEAPCWYGITPSETTLEQVREILPALELIDKENIDEDHITTGGPTISWSSVRDNDEHGFVSFDDQGVVSGITHYWGTEITLQRLIELKGEPDGLRPFVPNPESPTTYVQIFWFSQGFRVSVKTNVFPSEWDVISPVQPDSPVDHVQYVPIEPNAEMAFEGAIAADYYEWNGYQPVQQK